jgi:cyanophycinase
MEPLKRAARTALYGVCALMASWLSANPGPAAQAVAVGPERGWLVLHGGGTTRDHGATARFVSLAGGPSASIVVVLTPLDRDLLTPDFVAQYQDWWKSEFGVSDVTMLDTRSRQEADTEGFVAPLRRATGVWITGGHLTNLLDAYLGTRAEREMKAVVERGGAFGGASAGAMIQGSLLINVTKTPWGAPLPHSRMFLDPDRLLGFGLLRDVTVYPHLAPRHAEKDVAEVIVRYPAVLGIGIDENTAIVVHDDRFEVMGEGRVVVFDGRNRSVKDVTLRTGQRFDLKQRKVVR